MIFLKKLQKVMKRAQDWRCDSPLAFSLQSGQIFARTRPMAVSRFVVGESHENIYYGIDDRDAPRQSLRAN